MHRWTDEPTTIKRAVSESRGMRHAPQTQRTSVSTTVVHAGRGARSLAWPRGVPVTPATPYRTVSTGYPVSRHRPVNEVPAPVLDMRSRVERRRTGDHRDYVRAAGWWLALIACVGLWVGLWMAGAFLLALGLVIVGLGLVVVWLGATGRGL